jgi:hypothetical protein
MATSFSKGVSRISGRPLTNSKHEHFAHLVTKGGVQPGPTFYADIASTGRCRVATACCESRMLQHESRS